MKNLFLHTTLTELLLILICLCIPARPLHAAADDDSIDGYLQSADEVVEGIIVTQINKADRTIPGYIHGQSVDFAFGSVQDSIFQVIHSYQGSLAENQNIHIFTYPRLSSDVSDMQVRKRYIFFLKRHPFKNGYHILQNGKAGWQVFEYEGKKKLRAWNQYQTLRPAKTYEDYENFVSSLQDRLAQAHKN